jgi:hypothetical protein
MRRVSVSLITFSLVLIVFGAASVLNNNVRAEATVLTQAPGTRCTRLTYGPKEKKKKSDAKTGGNEGMGMFGSRCSRLSAGGREGTILPNTAPKVGLAASTAYIATNAEAQVKLKAIACDADNDNVLYTYSATGGRITGYGSEAVWNLSNATRPATYTVSVEVDDGCGCISFDSSQVTLE